MQVLNFPFNLLIFLIFQVQVVHPNELTLNFLIDFFQFHPINQIDAYLCNDLFESRRFLMKQFFKNYIQISVHYLDETAEVDDQRQYNARGIIIDPICSGSLYLMEKIANEHILNGINYVVLLSTVDEEENETIPNWGLDFLDQTEIYLNSEVVWAQKTYNSSFVLYDIYRVRLTRAVQVKNMGIYPENSIVEILSGIEPTGRRRKDFQGILLLARVVIQFPKDFTYIDDVRRRHIDPFTKWSFPSAKLLSEDLNFRYYYSIIDNFGWRNESGAFDGLMGMFQRKEIDFGMLGVLMRTDRIEIIDFTSETAAIETRLMFRKPSLSSLSNIYLLPFHSSVWIASGIICIITELVYVVVVWIENRKLEAQKSKLVNFFDTLSLLIGAICQQGISDVPLTISSRIVVLFAFITSIFLYTSYAANIVALLQTPSTAIKTVEDVVNSPLTVGVQSTVYNRIFLKESNHSATARFYDKKVLIHGDKGFIEADLGMESVRKGLFAFQVELAFAYEYMSNNYLEDEKCDLTEIELYRLPMQTIPVQKHSPFRDIFKQRLLWQREVGITDRKNGLWVPKKPKCDSTRSRYVSVGLTEFMPAIRVLLYGIICAIFLFICELFLNWQIKKLAHKIQAKKKKFNVTNKH